MVFSSFVFLLAFFFYIDGVYTVIDMATAYGQALGLDSTGLLLALLVTQIVAFPSVLIFGRIVKKVSPEKIITVCIMAYFGIAVYAYWLDTHSSCGNVPGNDTGAFKIIFCEDHTGGEVGRIFRHL